MARLGLVWRLALIVIAAILAVQLVFVAVILAQRGRGAEAGFPPRLPEQVAALARLMDDSLPDERAVALQAVRTAGLAASIAARLPAPDGIHLPRAEELIRRALPDRSRPISVYLHAGGGSGRPIRDFLSRRVVMAVGLASGEVLVVETAGELLSRIFGLPAGFLFSFIALAVAGLAILGVVRETRPLRQLSASVDRFGRELQAAPVPERGAPDVRALIRATNRMQERIASLVRNQGLMVGAIAHDLRTYLTRLRLRVEAIPEPERRDKAAGDVEGMQLLIEDALAFARTAFAEARADPVDLGRVLARAVEDRPQARLEAPVPQVTLRGSEAALTRAFANLVDNAIKYGERAEVRLALLPDAVLATVDDHGPGIPLRDRARIFEPFHRLDESRNRDREGAGLGLAIARQVIESHGGTITVEDRPGAAGGARFTVRLPR